MVYYALGGGHGHALRGLAVLRRVKELRPGLETRLIAPRRLGAWAEQEGQPAVCPPDESTTREKLRPWVEGTLATAGPVRLVVDVFPRGVLRDLESVLPGLRDGPWLIARWVRPDYYAQPDVRAVIESHYARLLWCEEPPKELLCLDVPQERVPPVLIRSVAECLERDEARLELGMPRDVPLVLALGTGDGERQQDLLRLLRKVRARRVPEAKRPFRLLFVSDVLAPSEADGVSVRKVFPAMRTLSAADVVVAGGGYSAVHEARALGLAAIHLPQQRRYDDQHWRVRSLSTARDPEELELALRSQLTRTALERERPAAKSDGAERIARLLVEQD